LPNFTAIKNTEFRQVEAYFRNWGKYIEASIGRIFVDPARLRQNRSVVARVLRAVARAANISHNLEHVANPNLKEFCQAL